MLTLSDFKMKHSALLSFSFMSFLPGPICSHFVRFSAHMTNLGAFPT